jgi:hypothetical protein
MRYTRTSSCRHTARSIGNIAEMANVGDCLIYTGQPIVKRASWLSTLKAALISFAVIRIFFTYRRSRRETFIIAVVRCWEGRRI